MSEFPIYPRPPIVEALIELRFATEMQGAELAGHLEPRLQLKGERQRWDQVELSVQVSSNGAQMSHQRHPHTHLLRSADGLQVIGCGPGVMTVHVLAPYPGWENFTALAEEAVNALPEAVVEAGFHTLGVRYVDRIVLPHGDIPNLEDYIVTLPPRPEAMPRSLTNFRVWTHAEDEDGTRAALMIAAAPPEEDGRLVVIYDLNVFRLAKPAFSAQRWRSVADELHSRQREIFEESITDELRQLFQ